VVGALAAVPQVRDLAVSTMHGVTAGPRPVAHGTSADEVAGDAIGNPESARASSYLPRHAQARHAVRSPSADPAHRGRTSAGQSVVPAHRPAGHHPRTPPSTSPKPARSSHPGTVGTRASHSLPRCTATGGMLPENYATIVDFLVKHGYSDLAAAGIAGNMWQESGGNPESVGSGGGGLIGFTPLPPGYVTGNPAADLRTQLNAVLTYNQQWSQFIPALNAAASAVQAADIYMNDFERPGLPAAANREAAAQAVAAACGMS
jgi:hypothetical protein